MGKVEQKRADEPRCGVPCLEDGPCCAACAKAYAVAELDPRGSFFVQLLEQLLVLAKADAAPRPIAPPVPEYLTIADFAARLAITPKAVRALIRDGMPSVRPRPRLTRIPVARAEAWIAERSMPTVDEAIAAARKRATVDARRGEIH